MRGFFAMFVVIQPYFKSCEHVCFAWGLELRGLGWVFGQYDVAYSSWSASLCINKPQRPQRPKSLLEVSHQKSNPFRVPSFKGGRVLTNIHEV